MMRHCYGWSKAHFLQRGFQKENGLYLKEDNCKCTFWNPNCCILKLDCFRVYQIILKYIYKFWNWIYHHIIVKRNNSWPRENEVWLCTCIIVCTMVLFYWKKNQNENVWILLHILLNFVHSDLIEVKPAIVQVMAWCHQATSQYLI